LEDKNACRCCGDRHRGFVNIKNYLSQKLIYLTISQKT
jgi:hypothetical protein